MPKGIVTENDLVRFYAHGAPMPAYGASWYLHLHTADPGNTSSTFETEYAGYAPVTVSRDVQGFTICDRDGTPNPSGSAFKNAAELTFPECSESFSTEIITHASLCSSAGQIIYKGALTMTIVVVAFHTPRIPAGGAIFVED